MKTIFYFFQQRQERQPTAVRSGNWFQKRFLFLLGIFAMYAGQAQTNTWDGSGGNNWNTASSWSLNVVPTAAHDVVIPNGITATINVNVNAVCKSFTMNGGGSSNTVSISASNSLTVTNAVTINAGTGMGDDKILAVNAGTLSCASVTIAATGSGTRTSELTLSTGTINVTGNISMGDNNDFVRFTSNGNLFIGGNITNGNLVPATGTVTCNGAAAQIITGTNTCTFYNLVINKTAAANTVTNNTNAVQVNNNLTITQGQLILNATNANSIIGNDLILQAAGTFIHNVNFGVTGRSLNLRGDWTNNGGVYTPGNGRVFFDGNTAQNINGTATTNFGLITISNAAGVTLGINTNVTGGTGALNFTSGLINTGSNVLALNSTSTITGAAATRYVNGNLSLGIATGNTNRVFDIGSSGGYAPVTLNFTNVTVTGNLTAFTTASDHAQILSSLIDESLSVNRTWTFSNAGVTFASTNASFVFPAANVDAGANTNNFIVGQYNAGWTYPVVSGRTATSTSVSAVTSLSGDFAIGEGGATAPTVTTHPTNVTACNNSSISFTSVASNKPASSVQWQISTNGGFSFINLTLAPPFSAVSNNAGGNTSSTLTINPVALGYQNYQFRAIFTNSRGTATSNPAVLTVNNNATANAGTAQSVCVGGSININGTIGGAASSSLWSAPSGSFLDNTQLFTTYTPSIASGTVTLTLTTDDPDGAGPCPAATSTLIITVNALPTTSNAGTNQTICTPGSAALNANNPAVGSGQWSVQSGPSTASAQFSNVNVRTANFTPAGGTGTYVLAWTISNGACEASVSTVTITVVPAVTTASAGTNQFICTGLTATLAANTPTIGTGSWSVISGPSTNLAQFSNVNQPNAVFTPAGGVGVYQLRWTISNGVCASLSTMTVSVSNPPSNPAITFIEGSNVTSLTINQCGPVDGGTENDIDLYNYTPPGGSTFQWMYSTNGGAWTNAGISPTAQEFPIGSFAGIAGTHQFQLIMTTSAGCVVSSNIITMTVNLPTANGNGTHSTCSGTNFSAGLTGFQAFTLFSWPAPVVTGGITGGIAGSNFDLTGNLVNNTASPQTATYTITPTYLFGTQTCSSTFNVVVTVYPLPSINSAASAASVCYSTSAQTSTLTYSSTTGTPNQYSITWNGTPANSFAAVNNAALPASPIIINVPANTNPGTYTGNLTVKNTDNCTSTTKTFTITVNALPSINSAAAATAVCYNTNAQTTPLTYSSTTGTPTTYSISWNPAPANSFAAVTNAALPASPIQIAVPAGTNPGTYIGTLTVRNANGCVSTNKTFTVTVNPLPSANWAATANTVCYNVAAQTSTLAYSSTSNSPNTYSITWNASPANSFVNITNAAFAGLPGGGTINISIPAGTNPGTYTGTISVRNGLTCVSSTTSFTLTVNAAPVTPGGISGSIEHCENSNGLLYSIAAVPNANTYNWSFPAGWTINGGAGTNNITVTAGNGSVSGNVSVTATNSCGTSAPAQLAVIVNAKGTWLGITGDWNNPGNWCGGVPDDHTDVFIPAGRPNDPVVSTAGGEARNITVANGAVLTIDGHALEIEGSISSNGGINLINGTLEMNGNSAQNISGSMFTGRTIQNILISNNHGVNFTGINDTLNVSGSLKFGISNATLNTNGNLNLLSRAGGTANISDMTAGGLYSNNQINGDVTVERFIPNHSKAWQFLAAPTSGQTINQAWQEGNSPLGNNKPGYGTILTSNLPGATGLGFDIATPSSSGPGIKTYNAATNSWDGVSSTSNPITNASGYMLLVRGDRSVTAFNQPATDLILRSSGSLYTNGAQAPPVINVGADEFASVGNPYASAIDFSKLNRTGGVQDVFYVWDPKLTSAPNSVYGLGGFQTLIGPGPNYTVIPGGGSFAGGNVAIESGMAFFVKSVGTAGTLSFAENAKVDASNLVTRQGGQEYPKVKVNLSVLINNEPVLLDGAIAQYDLHWSDGVDLWDARKVNTQSAEQISIKNGSYQLVAERRSKVLTSDSIQLNLAGMKQRLYRLSFDINLSLYPGLFPVLIDKYLNTENVISSLGQFEYNFSVDGNAGSFRPDRFLIVFRPTGTVPVRFLGITARYVPALKVNRVQWSVELQLGVREYVIEKSVDGRRFTEIGRIEANNSESTSYQFDDASVLPLQYYRVRTMETDQSDYSDVAKVQVVLPGGGFTVYPNPVQNKQIELYANGISAGVYQLKLVENSGKVVFIKNIKMSENQFKIIVNLNKNTASGSYYLHLIGQNTQVLPVLIQ
jgi:hypothetical protein